MGRFRPSVLLSAFFVLLLIQLPLSLAADIRPAPPDGIRQAVLPRPIGLAALTPITSWRKIAPGVWRAEAGDVSREIRYTSLAAAPPRLEALARRDERDFPFAGEPLAWERTADGKTALRVPCGEDEKLYGFGLQLDGLDRSQAVLTLNVDHWGKGSGRTHAPVPFYVSSRGYGVFIDTARFLKVYARVGNRKDSLRNPLPVDRNPPPGEAAGPWQAQPRSDAVEALLDGPGAEIVVLAGRTMADVVERYNLLCGGGALPPLWGLGFWHRVHAEADEAQVLREAAEFERRGIPLDVIGLEPGWMTKSYPCTFEWQPRRFPDPAGFAAGLLGRGVRLNLWENPYVAPQSRLYKTLFPLSGSHLAWLGLVPDYTLPEARRALLDQHAADHAAIGVSGYKIDEVDGYDVWLWPDHASFPSGTPAPVMRQTYGLLMQDMIFKGLFKARDVRTYGLVRAGNGGASGYPFAIYSDAYDLKEYIAGIGAAGLSGLLWTPEIRDAEDEHDWLDRMQVVCFSALAQLNAWASGTTPWHYPAAVDRVREAIRLRMRLLPYLYSAFAAYRFEGRPPLRPMLLEDPALGRVEDQFMFGPSILVAPFYGAKGWSRQVVLPEGDWYDFRTGKLVPGGRRIECSSESGEIPLFVREGSLIPMIKEPPLHTDQAYGRPLEVRFYGRRGGIFDLYEDDGKTFGYEKGRYRIRRLTVSEDAGGVFRLTETVLGDGIRKDGVPKDGVRKDAAPAMFGPAELRVMTPR